MSGLRCAAVRLRRWWSGEQGSVTVETVILAPFLVMLLVFVGVFVHRGVDARLRLDDAAHQAARAATLQRTTATATAAAHDTATSALAQAGIVCRAITVTLTGNLAPAGSVTVTVGCTVDFGPAVLLGVPATRTLDSTASEVVDTYRSQPAGATP